MENFHMNGGVDEKTSYSMNSSLGRKVISITRPIIQEAVDDIFVSATKDINQVMMKTFSFADLGCSSGPNTLLLVSSVLDIVQRNCQQPVTDLPEFLVFINDLPANDFNSTFRSLPDYYNQLTFGRRCFIVGVPGSFYGRLFPTKSLHYAHSSFCLHWLSQVPRGIEDNNKGNIYISKSSPPAVLESYLHQFESDFSMFLEARAEEIVHGGRMVITLIGRRNNDPSTSRECCYQKELLAAALTDMVSEGIIEEEKLNSFNLPVYNPSPMELETAITNEGSFEIKLIETFELNWDGEYEVSEVFDKFKSSATITNNIRAVYEHLVVSHFGADQVVVDKLFRRFRELIEECHSTDSTNYHVIVVVSLNRK